MKNGHANRSIQSPKLHNLSNRCLLGETETLSEGATSPSSDSKLDYHFSMVLQSISESILTNELRLVEQDRRDAIKLQWQQVAIVADRLLMLIFVSLTLGITLGLTMQGVV